MRSMIRGAGTKCILGRLSVTGEKIGALFIVLFAGRKSPLQIEI